MTSGRLVFAGECRLEARFSTYRRVGARPAVAESATIRDIVTGDRRAAGMFLAAIARANHGTGPRLVRGVTEWRAIGR